MKLNGKKRYIIPSGIISTGLIVWFISWIIGTSSGVVANATTIAGHIPRIEKLEKTPAKIAGLEEKMVGLSSAFVDFRTEQRLHNRDIKKSIGQLIRQR